MKTALFLITLIFLANFNVDPIDKKIKEERNLLATKKAKEIVKRLIKTKYSEFEKVMILHDYITDNVVYGKWNGDTSAYTALVHNKSDCVGFARGLHRLFEAAGLDGFVVARKRGHLWVKVKIRGKYYNIDPTWSALKSRWPQYNWFLLSDAQNIDTEKGVDHILDSGEIYEPALDIFKLSKKDFANKKELYSPDKLRIIGTINLPKGYKAPAGGIIGSVGGSRFHIPEGESTAFYIASFKRKIKTPPVLQIKVKRDSENIYPAESYYLKGKTVKSKSDAFRFDLKSLDYTDINFTLSTLNDLES